MARAPKTRAKRARGKTTADGGPAEAKVFMTGRSQAVRLPKEFRFVGDSVHINRLGNTIVLTPKTGDRWTSLFAALDAFPRDFTLERDQTQPERLGLSELFEKTKE
jgi:antitoxin VapB